MQHVDYMRDDGTLALDKSPKSYYNEIVRNRTNLKGGVTIENRSEMFAKFHKHWTEINAAYERYARTLSISYSALQVLCEIYNSDVPVTQRRICEIAHLPKTTVNAIIAGFVKQGYVGLREIADDRRQKIICFTDAGYAYAKPIMEHMSRSEMRAFEMLDETTMQAMIAGIEEYQKNFNEKLNQTNGGK